MSHSDSIRRTIELLSRLNEGQALNVDRLAAQYGVHPRSIRRDLALIKEIFGEFIRKDGDAYRAYDKLLLDRVLHSGELMQLSGIASMFDLASTQTELTQETHKLLSESERIYAYKNKPFEVLHHPEVVRQIEHVIKYRMVIDIDYQTQDGSMHIPYEPYRIVFMQENFYLMGKNTRTARVELLRIGRIIGVQRTGKTFLHDRDIERFIEQAQTPWANYDKPPQTVRIRVDTEVSKYFYAKLPAQPKNHRAKPVRPAHRRISNHQLSRNRTTADPMGRQHRHPRTPFAQTLHPQTTGAQTRTAQTQRKNHPWVN